jgi:hypothetical protein
MNEFYEWIGTEGWTPRFGELKKGQILKLSAVDAKRLLTEGKIKELKEKKQPKKKGD